MILNLNNHKTLQIFNHTSVYDCIAHYEVMFIKRNVPSTSECRNDPPSLYIYIYIYNCPTQARIRTEGENAWGRQWSDRADDIFLVAL